MSDDRYKSMELRCGCFFFFFSSRRRHTRWNCDWSSDVCSSDLFGKSSQPTEGYNYDTFAEDLHKLITHLKLQDFTDRKSTRLNSSHSSISYAVFCLKKKKKKK